MRKGMIIRYLLLMGLVLFPLMATAQSTKVVIFPFDTQTDITTGPSNYLGSDLAGLLELQLHFTGDLSIVSTQQWKQSFEAQLPEPVSEEPAEVDSEPDTTSPNMVPYPASYDHPLSDLQKENLKVLQVEYVIRGHLQITTHQSRVRLTLNRVFFDPITDQLYLQTESNLQLSADGLDLRSERAHYQSYLPGSFHNLAFQVFQKVYEHLRHTPLAGSVIHSNEVEVLLALDLTEGMQIPLDIFQAQFLESINAFTGDHAHIHFRIGILTAREPCNDPNVRVHPFTHHYVQLDEFIRCNKIQQGIHNRININRLLDKAVEEVHWSHLNRASRQIFLLTDSIQNGDQPDRQTFQRLKHYGIRVNIIQCAGLNEQTQYAWQQAIAETGGSFAFLTYQINTRIDHELVAIFYHGKQNGSIFIQPDQQVELSTEGAFSISRTLFNLNRDEDVLTIEDVYDYLKERGVNLHVNEDVFYNQVSLNLEQLFQQQMNVTLPPAERDIPHIVFRNGRSIYSLELPVDPTKLTQTLNTYSATEESTNRVLVSGEIVPNRSQLGFTLNPNTICIHPKDFFTEWFGPGEQQERMTRYLVRTFDQIQPYTSTYESEGIFFPTRWFFFLTFSNQ